MCTGRRAEVEVDVAGRRIDEEFEVQAVWIVPPADQAAGRVGELEQVSHRAYLIVKAGD
jgi:hypothetical protein